MGERWIKGAPWFFLTVASLLYIGSFGISFWMDPLGQVAVLDARENLAWAQWIREGSLPGEPLYRALLYPLVLALFPAGTFPEFAILLGLVFHLWSACLVGMIAQRVWAYSPAAWLSGLIYSVYPVALYFAGQVLDITLATSLFLVGVYWLVRCTQESRPRKTLVFALAAGFFAGLAVLVRPNFLPAALCFPLIVVFMQSRPWRATACVTSGLLLLLALQGFVNLRLSGDFRVLPWQGAYNLYAANREGANGKFYTQRLAFESVPAGANTTRMESEYLYQEATGARPPLKIDAMSDYWRSQLIEGVLADPLRWTGLMLRKSFYLINDWEQYNNLSYAYHKARLPLLNWNPLGWGVLLLMATAGLFLGYRHVNRTQLYAVALIAMAYAAGLLLFFVSARFRLPLVPLLCLAAGGCAFWSRNVLSRAQWKWFIASLTVVAILSFGNWFSARDRTTFIQDDYLLARASSETGEDRQALRLARNVLGQEPAREDARRLEVVSLFNLWLETYEPAYWQAMGTSLRSLESRDPAVVFIRGVFLWRSGMPEQAIAQWRAGVRDYGARAQSSLDALQAVGQATVDTLRLNAVRQLRGILEIEADAE